MSPAVRRARTAFLWVGVIVPLAVLAVTAVIVALWLPEIPEPSAIHWGTDGVDGYGPGWTHLAVLGGIAVLIVGFALLAWFVQCTPAGGRSAPASDAGARGWSPTARFLGAVNLGLAGLIALVTLVGVGSQRGLVDASQTPDIGPAVLAGFALLVVGALVGWVAQPKTPRPVPSDAPGATPLVSSASERVVWIGTATIAPRGLAVLGGAVLLTCGLAAVVLATGDGGIATSIILVSSALVVALAVAVTFSFRVRIGPAGLVVRSRVGWPSVRIPASDVAAVRAIEVAPFAEFGGWGLRYGLDGRSGVVLRRGEALEVTRDDGRRFVVTIDDADEAAAVLATAARKEA